jgi:hypothetical protein
MGRGRVQRYTDMFELTGLARFGPLDWRRGGSVLGLSWNCSLSFLCAGHIGKGMVKDL